MDPEHDSTPQAAIANGATSSVGEGWVPRSAIVALLALMMLTAALLLYCIWAFWPAPSTPGAGAAAAVVDKPRAIGFFGAHMKISPDDVLFVIVAATGALGGLLHTVRSLSWYLGNRSLRWSWVPFYLLLPLVGAAGATVFYLVFRAGLFSPSTTTQANPYGFAAIAALVGLFSEQAMEKLHDVFGSLLAPARAGRDTVRPKGAPEPSEP